MSAGWLLVLVWAGAPCSMMSQTGGPALHVRTADGRMTYYIGERIPLALDFTAPGNKQFEINMASYDRSGRMNYESFDVEPRRGWADPLADYYGTLVSILGGGLSSTKALDPAPTTIPFDLNESVRFDEPGTYCVTVTSHRVRRVSAGAFPWGAEELALRSQTLELHIVKAPVAWQKAKLAAIAAALQAKQETSAPSEQRRKAIADLRFLATPDGIELMAAHVRDGEPEMLYQCAFGLAGVPENLRPAALDALQKQIDDPAFPVSGWVLQVIPVLEMDGSAGSDDPKEQAQQRERLWKEAREMVVHALPAKEGQALVKTAEMLLANGGPSPDPKEITEISQVIAAHLDELPPEDQTAELQYHWDEIGTPELLPLLRQLSRTAAKPQTGGGTDWQTRELKTAALRRWYAIDPAGAREEALRQIGVEHPSVTADVVSFLSPEKFPQFEGIWGYALMTTDDAQEMDLLLELLTRFGSGTETGLVREKLQEMSGRACRPLSHELSYLVKFDPAGAGPLVARAIQTRGAKETPCRQASLQEIGRNANNLY